MSKKTKVHSYGENYGINILIVRLNFKMVWLMFGNIFTLRIVNFKRVHL